MTVFSRQRAPQHPASGAGDHRAVRFLVVVIGFACATGAAKSVASYTSTEWPQTSIGRASIDTTLRKKVKSETEAQSSAAQSSKSPVRIADVTDDWLQALQNPAFWRRNTSEPGRKRRDARPRVKSYTHRASTKRQRPPSESIRYQSARLGDGVTYRTMCVRLCDGYYWPVSFTATKGEFARDSDVCARSCDSPAALHVYKNPGEEPDDMVDLSGRPYAKLGNAFRHRVGYDPACKCRPHPWETSSRQRHSSYLQR